MKINAMTDNPKQLVSAINRAIEDGKLRTWRIINSKEGILYSHSPQQWDETAMLEPNVYKNMVSFEVSWWDDEGEPIEGIKGYISGRFTEILLVHFSDYFTKLEIFA